MSLFAWLAAGDSKQLFRGVFARSPSEFAHCATLEQRSRMVTAPASFAITNRGVSFKVYVFSSAHKDRLHIDLDCRTGGVCRRCGTEHAVYVGLQHTADGWVRRSSTECWLVDNLATPSRGLEEICVRKHVNWERSKDTSKSPPHSFRVNVDLEASRLRTLWRRLSSLSPGRCTRPVYHELGLWLVRYLNGRTLVILGMKPHPDWEIVEGLLPEATRNLDRRRRYLLDTYRHETSESGATIGSQLRVRVKNRHGGQKLAYQAFMGPNMLVTV
ncbi:hypothetical protein LX36DRAFT_706675 [Colletotrichum falcatum]|nr:hypothetical protein LX36DRAFT_706675 [Colletotrichum falcatum]